MGCCSSAFSEEGNVIDNTLNMRYMAASKQIRGTKRNYFAHVSGGSSSGVSSACTSPTRSSVLSRSKSMPSSYRKGSTPRAKTSNFAGIIKKNKTAFGMSICDDFGEAENLQQQQDNKSYGYYSESISTGSSVSTPHQSCLRRTQDTSLSPALPPLIGTNELRMEMYIMSQSKGLMPKTSSPIFQHRHVTFDAVAEASPSSNSYIKWANYLQSTPTHMLHNVTDIPEAVAGHFSPLHFPAFTDLEEMESAAKRFKVDIHFARETKDDVFDQDQIFKPSNLTHTITTDL